MGKVSIHFAGWLPHSRARLSLQWQEEPAILKNLEGRKRTTGILNPLRWGSSGFLQNLLVKACPLPDVAMTEFSGRFSEK